MKFIIKNSEDGQFYFKIESKNGQVLLTSETYLKKSSARRTIGVLNRQFSTPLPVIDLTDDILKKAITLI